MQTNQNAARNNACCLFTCIKHRRKTFAYELLICLLKNTLVLVSSQAAGYLQTEIIEPLKRSFNLFRLEQWNTGRELSSRKLWL